MFDDDIYCCVTILLIMIKSISKKIIIVMLNNSLKKKIYKMISNIINILLIIILFLLLCFNMFVWLYKSISILRVHIIYMISIQELPWTFLPGSKFCEISDLFFGSILDPQKGVQNRPRKMIKKKVKKWPYSHPRDSRNTLDTCLYRDIGTPPKGGGSPP
jgi:hypothetical protein